MANIEKRWRNVRPELKLKDSKRIKVSETSKDEDEYEDV